MTLVGRMYAVGIDEFPRGGGSLLVIDLVERGEPVHGGERPLVFRGLGGVELVHRLLQQRVHPADEVVAELVQRVEGDLDARRIERGAGVRLDERGVLTRDGVVDLLEDDDRVGVELDEAVDDLNYIAVRAFPSLACGVAVERDVEPVIVASYHRVADHLMHGDILTVGVTLELDILAILQDIIAEYGNVQDIGGLDVRDQPARAVVTLLVGDEGEHVVGEMPGDGMVVVSEIVAPADDIGVGVLMPERQRGRAEDAFRDGVAEVDDLRLVGRSHFLPLAPIELFVIRIARDQCSGTGYQQKQAEQNRDGSLHNSSLTSGRARAPHR